MRNDGYEIMKSCTAEVGYFDTIFSKTQDKLPSSVGRHFKFFTDTVQKTGISQRTPTPTAFKN